MAARPWRSTAVRTPGGGCLWCTSPGWRAEGFYGLTLYEDIKGVQDELNMRLADIGDNINNASHPIRWIRNYRGDPKDLQMGADALWDLGQSIPGQDPPDVGVIPAQPEPASSFNFITFMLDMTRQAAFTSPVAFGEDEGSQRSGVTLTLRLWPLLQQVKTTRIYWRTQLVTVRNLILAMARYRDVDRRYDPKVVNYGVVPNFADLVPQDRQLLIDEITRRAERDLVSPEEALARFGVRAGTEQDEIERIKDWLKFRAEQQAQHQVGARGPAGKTQQPQAKPDASER